MIKKLLFLLIFPVLSSAQVSPLKQSILRRFTNPEEIKWFRHYKGRIDDFNDVLATLAFDGKEIKGQMMYLRSKVIFKWEGQLYGNQLDLIETDIEGFQTGNIEGLLTGNIIKAVWSNKNYSTGSKILLTEINQINDLPTHCGDNKWTKHFFTKEDKIQYEIILQKGANNQVWGIAYFGEESLKIKGELNSKNQFQLQLKNKNDQNFEFIGDFKNHRNLKAVFDWNGQKKNLMFKMKEHLPTGCLDYADYQTSYDALFPKTKNAAFNNWMETTIMNWVTDCRSHIIQNKSSENDPELRASQKASAWCDLEFYSNQMISGFLVLDNNWSEKKEIAFNYNLKTGRAITENTLFKNHFDRKHFIQNAAENYFKNHPLYINDDFKEWITRANFPHFTIRQNGINFSTDFDIFYGRQSITVPWIELSEFLKAENPVKALGNSK